MKNKIKLILLLGVVLSLVACSDKQPSNTIKVGTIAGPETELMVVAKDVAKKKYGLNIEIIAFSDYNVPNQALNNGSINANMFQHIPYLESQIQQHGYKIVSIGKTFVYPMGLYSKKVKTLAELKPNAKIAIPNDPSNEARALLLLQKAQLIKLKPGVGIKAMPVDIVANPKHFKIIELDAAELSRALRNVGLAAINTNFAMPAGLSPSKDALFEESADSPYANIIVVRASDKNNPQLKELVEALHSKEVLQKAKQLFGDGAIPAWNNKNN